MSNFIPTENVILVSILCRKMPGLLNYIKQYSTPPGKKPPASKQVSAHQIREASLHPSTTIKQILKVIANIQRPLKKASKKQDTIVKQRAILESTLTKLRSLSNKDT